MNNVWVIEEGSIKKGKTYTVQWYMFNRTISRTDIEKQFCREIAPYRFFDILEIAFRLKQQVEEDSNPNILMRMWRRCLRNLHTYYR